MESILNSIKKLLGIADDYTPFDPDIIIHINSVFSILTNLGVGPDSGYKIVDANNTWDEFISESDSRYSMLKTYVYQKVRLLFDPPLTTNHIEALNKSVAELEWRLQIQSEVGQ